VNVYNSVWALSKLRFLETVPYYWLLSNKVLEILFFSGAAIFLYFDLSVYDNFKYLKYIAIIIALWSIGAISSRLGSYEGYFDGYEQGFKDAATHNVDYWSEENDIMENISISNALKEIKINAERMSEEHKQQRTTTINKNFKKLIGWVLTWKKIR
jgi:hypothetical protein